MRILFLAIALLTACDKSKAKGKQESGAKPTVAAMHDGKDGLAALIQATHAACTGKDFKKGRELVLAVVPTKDQLVKIFKDDVPATQLDKLVDKYKELPATDEGAACFFYPGQGRTQITVHQSTVEELIAYKEHTAAFEEFPGGAQKLAETYLRPGRTFYEVEVTEPGKDTGTKFHLFFWDGAGWRMLGPAWRMLHPE